MVKKKTLTKPNNSHIIHKISYMNTKTQTQHPKRENKGWQNKGWQKGINRITKKQEVLSTNTPSHITTCTVASDRILKIYIIIIMMMYLAFTHDNHTIQSKTIIGTWIEKKSVIFVLNFKIF